MLGLIQGMFLKVWCELGRVFRRGSGAGVGDVAVALVIAPDRILGE
jgi:hypothetical protein